MRPCKFSEAGGWGINHLHKKPCIIRQHRKREPTFKGTRRKTTLDVIMFPCRSVPPLSVDRGWRLIDAKTRRPFVHLEQTQIHNEVSIQWRRFYLHNKDSLTLMWERDMSTSKRGWQPPSSIFDHYWTHKYAIVSQVLAMYTNVCVTSLELFDPWLWYN